MMDTLKLELHVAEERLLEELRGFRKALRANAGGEKPSHELTIGFFGKLLQMPESQIANAIAMAAASGASFAVIRAKPLSQWKGFASSESALNAMNTLFLARRGMQGPLQVIEGPLGLDNLLQMHIDIDWNKENYEGVTTSTIKKYNAMIHTQSAIYCMLQLITQHNIDPSKVVSIEADITQMTYDFSGGGLYGIDKTISTKEQADHNLFYLLAVALLDHDVTPAHREARRSAIAQESVGAAERGIYCRLSQRDARQDRRALAGRNDVRK